MTREELKRHRDQAVADFKRGKWRPGKLLAGYAVAMGLCVAILWEFAKDFVGDYPVATVIIVVVAASIVVGAGWLVFQRTLNE